MVAFASSGSIVQITTKQLSVQDMGSFEFQNFNLGLWIPLCTNQQPTGGAGWPHYSMNVQLKTLRSVSKWKSLLALCNVYRRFVLYVTIIAALLKKSQKRWEEDVWTVNHEERGRGRISKTIGQADVSTRSCLTRKRRMCNPWYGYVW